MSGAIYISAAGALNYQKKLEILANNIANVNTTGFKEDRTTFRIYDMESSETDKSTTLSAGKSEPFIPLPSGTQPVFSQGGMRQTGNTLDLAIEGEGFFSIQTPDGIRYTRNGSFNLDKDGVLVTKDGFPVLGDGGEIKIDDDDKIFTVDDEGNISADENQIGRLNIVDFPRPYALSKLGNTLFAVEDKGAKEITAERFQIKQGYIELSNVDVIKSMTEMIEAFRGYESYQKVIKSIDDVNGKAINEIGRIG
ncbi:MAG: flagellar basal-body rod protein FlgF [Deltaproteobacteria bacterium]|nr:flagellar basal-body rod protein FlgF [Deltaproteobacteria bacterium]